MCLFCSFFQSTKYAFLYWKEDTSFIPFLFHLKKKCQERNTNAVFELISP